MHLPFESLVQADFERLELRRDLLALSLELPPFLPPFVSPNPPVQMSVRVWGGWGWPSSPWAWGTTCAPVLPFLALVVPLLAWLPIPILPSLALPWLALPFLALPPWLLLPIAGGRLWPCPPPPVRVRAVCPDMDCAITGNHGVPVAISGIGIALIRACVGGCFPPSGPIWGVVHWAMGGIASPWIVLLDPDLHVQGLCHSYQPGIWVIPADEPLLAWDLPCWGEGWDLSPQLAVPMDVVSHLWLFLHGFQEGFLILRLQLLPLLVLMHIPVAPSPPPDPPPAHPGPGGCRLDGRECCHQQEGAFAGRSAFANMGAIAGFAFAGNEAFAGQGCQAQQQKHHGHS